MSEEQLDIEEVEKDEEEVTGRSKPNLCAGEVYDIILRHPDWRVVEVSQMGSEYSHPLKYIWSSKGLLFQYDGAARQMHHEAECEEIIDLHGAEPIEGEDRNHKVYICQDIFADKWEWDNESIVEVKKASLDASAQWIKLHPAD